MKRQVYLNTFYRSNKRKIAIILALIFLVDIASPTAAWALTGGPTQPEVSSFEPVSTNQMVDLFTGDFTYNIPLMDVGGYPINIAYHGGVGMEQEASWVGLGWNINPGVINRGVRGIPDDFNGDVITRKINIKEDRTLSIKAGLNLEVLGLKADKIKNKKLSGKLKLGLQFFYNNYKGYYIAPDLGFNMELNASSEDKVVTPGLKFGINHDAQNGLSTYARPTLSISGLGSKSEHSLDLGIGGGSFNLRTRSLNLSLVSTLSVSKVTDEETQESKDARKKVIADNIVAKIQKSVPAPEYMRIGASVGPIATIPIGQNTYIPNSVPQMQSIFGNIRIAVGPEVGGTQPSYYLEGNYNERFLFSKDNSEKSYGYLYLQERPFDYLGRYQGLTDFNRDGNASQFNPNMSYLAPANMTYDVLSVSAQGTGGMYRPFRNDVGIVSDATFENKGLNGAALGIEIGLGSTARFGADITIKNSIDRGANWTDRQMNPYGFSKNEKESLKENVYYKVAGELVPVSETFNALGGEDLRTFDILNNQELQSNGINMNSEVTYSSKNGLSPRQPRGKLITHLNGTEANEMGLDKKIISYKSTYKAQKIKTGHIESINRYKSNPQNLDRKSHHTSEITQYEKDGSRYVFGIPAMNKLKKEVMFNAQDLALNNAETRVSYDPNKLGIGYTNGRDNFYSSTETPAYAHSYLLTGYLSPDYVDVTGNGITKDDLGNAVKFNWTRTTENMGWRTPLGKDSATFLQGNEADPYDNKASYTYGEKEMWYVQSIESRNYIAIFTLGERHDALSVNEDGSNNTSVKSKKLTKIELFSKEDLENNPSSATPIKVVEFKYKDNGGGLCESAPNNDNKDETSNNLPSGTEGTKLTLEEISFKFGDNDASAFDPYKFEYNDVYKNTTGTTSNISGSYNPEKIDKWGNFKGKNVASLSKEEYPYTNQQVEKEVADSWAGLWNLNKITLPSGGTINVTYESDDYAYIQDKRAMEMVRVIGASATKAYNTSNELYSDGGRPGKQKYHLIFELPDFVKSETDAAEKVKKLKLMFDGVDNLYYRMKIKVKDGITEENYVSGYATIDNNNYGICAAPNPDYGYVKLDQFKGGSTGRREMNPIVANAMSFYDQYMSETVSPGGNVNTNGNSDWQTISKKFVSIIPDLIQAVVGPVKFMLANGVAQKFDTSKSFIRLVKPDHKKFGGGHRVSKIELNDNWSSISTESNSTYGQKYTYTIEENGIQISSGVATYEPLIGGDENPLRHPTKYQQKKNPGATPNWDLYQETPMGESFYPSASVGYSRVLVRNLHHDKPSSKFYKEHKFYTAKEFPVEFKNTRIQVKEPSKWAGKFKPPVGYWHTKNYYTATQGYTFILNDMHGKLWQENHYSEKAEEPLKLSGKEYIYHGTNPEENDFDMDNVVQAVMRNGNVNQIQLGKELDVTIDSKEIYHKNVSHNVQGSLDLFALFPFPIVLYLEDKNEIQYRSVVVTKLIQNYGLLSDIVEFDMNRVVKTSNVLYDGHSGDLLVSKVENEYGNSILSSTLPAYWAEEYDRMGHAYRNVGFRGDGGDKVTILGSCATANQNLMNYMNHFIYEGLIDSYLGNHKAYNVDNGQLTGIFGNLVTKNIFVSGDEIYNKDGGTDDKHLWVINVLDKAQVNLMANGTNGSNGTICSGSSITGLTSTSVEEKCDGVLTETQFLNQIVQDVSTAKSTNTTIVKGFVDAFINYSNATGSEATAKDICGYLDELPLNSKNMKAYKESKSLMDFSALLSKKSSGFSYQYDLNSTAALVKFILDRSDLKGVMNLFVEDGMSLTTKQRADIFEYIMANPKMVDYLICKMSYPAILQFVSKVGCNSDAFDLVRYVLKNESNEFIKSSSTYNSLTYNAENRPTGGGSDIVGNISMMSLFSNTHLPDNFWKYTLNENRILADLDFEKCYSHQFVDCDYSFDYTNSTTVTPPSVGNMNGCCTFDGESFDMAGKDLVIFINRAGDIVDVENNELKITRSGRRNMITAKVGEVSSMEYGPFADNYKLPSERNKYFSSDKVINASAMEYSEEWVTDRTLENSTSINPYVYGIRGNFRPKSGYYINDNRNELGALTMQTPDLSKDGMFTDFTPFWEFAGYMNKLAKTSTASDNWIKSSEITYYSAIHGNSIEERTPLDQTGNNVIYTTELIGAHNLASAVANNAQHNEVLFEDFEGYTRQDYIQPHNNIYTTAEINSSNISKHTAHTGQFSLRAGTDNNVPVSGQLNIDQANTTVLQLNQNNSDATITFNIPLIGLAYNYGKKYFLDGFNPSEGTYIISGWIKDGLNADYKITGSSRMDAKTEKVTYQTTATFTANGVNCLSNIQIAPFVEGWQRFQAEFTVTNGMTSIPIVFKGGRYGAYMDDLRIYPKDAVMKTYVYHPDVMRLAAQLDENNYATFYDYDFEGNLIRIRKETEKGIMTIQENAKHSAAQ
jgi:hypothetical protein